MFWDVQQDETAIKYVNSSQVMDIIEPQFIEVVKEQILLPSVILPDIIFTSLKNLNRIVVNSSTKLPVIDLNKAPQRGADSNLHWYNYHDDFNYHNDTHEYNSVTIIILLLSFTMILVCLHTLIYDNENSEMFNNSEFILGGRYRYTCRGTSLNNKRCKRCVKNATTCYQHI